MNITVNGNQINTDSTTLISIIYAYYPNSKENLKGIAIAINGEIVPKSEWNSYNIRENDTIELISATQGG
jgi:sulfur carrier protein